MSLNQKGKARKGKVYAKMLETAHRVAGNSKSGMTVEEALALTERELAKRSKKRKAQKAARRRNRK